MHFHSLTPDGLFVADRSPNQPLFFVPLEPPGPEDVARLTRREVRRLSKITSRYLAEHEDICIDPDDEQATLDHALSVAHRPPLRPQGVLGPSGLEPPTPPRKELCTALGGLSLHAARVVESHDRQGLERLCRYGLRAPFSQKGLSVLSDGRVRYELPRPWPNPSGVVELTMDTGRDLERIQIETLDMVHAKSNSGSMLSKEDDC